MKGSFEEDEKEMRKSELLSVILSILALIHLQILTTIDPGLNKKSLSRHIRCFKKNIGKGSFETSGYFSKKLKRKIPCHRVLS
jgi:hypothetical protein